MILLNLQPPKLPERQPCRMTSVLWVHWHRFSTDRRAIYNGSKKKIHRRAPLCLWFIKNRITAIPWHYEFPQSHFWWLSISCLIVTRDCLLPTSSLPVLCRKSVEAHGNCCHLTNLSSSCDRISISVIKGRKVLCLCVIVGLCHTPQHTPDLFSHDWKTLLQAVPPLSANHPLRIMLPCLNFAVVLCLLQFLCITADIGTYPLHIFFYIKLACE